MSRFSGTATILPDTNLTFHLEQQVSLGTEIAATDGSVYRYTRYAVAPVAGNLFQAPVAIAAHSGLVITAAAAVGNKQLTITNGATAITENQYAEGTVTVQTGTGLAQMYTITGNSQTAAAGVITVYLDLPVEQIIPVASTLSLNFNKYDGVVLATTTTTGVVGLCNADSTIIGYGYVQVRGVAVVVGGEAITAGDSLTASSATAGTVMPTAAATTPGIGFANTAITATQGGLVTLLIA